MKRDATPSTPAPAALHPRTGTRTTRLQLDTARLALLDREYRIAELTAHIEDRHPDRALDMVRLVERLHQLGEIELVGDMLGLTDEGERYARQVKAAARAHQVPARTKPSGESGRRRDLLASTDTDPYALTSGRRTGGSAADLAAPPMRPGAQACMDLPSRIGNYLHYRDGRITRVEGTQVQPAHTPRNYKPTRDGSSRAQPVWTPN